MCVQIDYQGVTDHGCCAVSGCNRTGGDFPADEVMIIIIIVISHMVKQAIRFKSDDTDGVDVHRDSIADCARARSALAVAV